MQEHVKLVRGFLIQMRMIYADVKSGTECVQTHQMLDTRCMMCKVLNNFWCIHQTLRYSIQDLH